jgi:hypothetical protein
MDALISKAAVAGSAAVSAAVSRHDFCHQVRRQFHGFARSRPDATAWRGTSFFWRRRASIPWWCMAAARPSRRAMEKAGLKASFIQGMRVTDEATAQVVEQVLSREINPEDCQHDK